MERQSNSVQVHYDWANVTHMSAAASGRAAAHVCGDQDHRSRDCPCIQSDEEGLGPLQQAALEMDGVSEASLMRKGYKATKDDEEMRSMTVGAALGHGNSEETQPASHAGQPVGEGGNPYVDWDYIRASARATADLRHGEGDNMMAQLTDAERKMIVKAREKQGRAAAKRIEQKAITGQRADYYIHRCRIMEQRVGGLQHGGECEEPHGGIHVEEAAMAGSGQGGVGGGLSEGSMEEEPEMAGDAAGQGGCESVGTPGSYAPTTPCSGGSGAHCEK